MLKVSFDYFSSFRVKPEMRGMLMEELFKTKGDRLLRFTRFSFYSI